ncbi:hypothetical protein PGIGA_G00115870 [Pangasianodon gigas]|uniref:Uncharacterized protein n=1 Tax=Pangasianodon gigas TaxID=30993 RepID=A0ACC5XF88_PANGG|nr:hypothetical protein [Pangasianodon gigas]
MEVKMCSRAKDSCSSVLSNLQCYTEGHVTIPPSTGQHDNTITELNYKESALVQLSVIQFVLSWRYQNGVQNRKQ